jgi:hypothetical protein
VTSQTTIVRNTKLQSRDRVDQRFPNSDTKSDFLEFERRWLTLVIGFKSDAELVVGCERKAG